MESCNYEPPEPSPDCPHCNAAGPVSFAIQVGDEPPFHVNTALPEEFIERAEQG